MTIGTLHRLRGPAGAGRCLAASHDVVASRGQTPIADLYRDREGQQPLTSEKGKFACRVSFLIQ